MLKQHSLNACIRSFIKITREKAREISSLLYLIETYEALIDEITGLQVLDDLPDRTAVEEELIAVVQTRLDQGYKELEEI